jgi:hypothetical protein
MSAATHTQKERKEESERMKKKCGTDIVHGRAQHQVLSGFTSGAAIIIMGSQLKHLFRISMSGNTLIEYIESFANSASDIHGWTTGTTT